MTRCQARLGVGPQGLRTVYILVTVYYTNKTFVTITCYHQPVVCVETSVKHVTCYNWILLEETVLRTVTVNLIVRVMLGESKYETGNNSGLRLPMHLTKRWDSPNMQYEEKKSIQNVRWKTSKYLTDHSTMDWLLLFNNAVSTTNVEQ